MYHEEVFCPCCGSQLRAMPHNEKKSVLIVMVHSPNENTLREEIKSWKGFEYALREENRLLFNNMLSECRENECYIRAANSKDEFFSAESLFMVLILQQQRMINELIAKVSAAYTKSKE